MAWWHKKEVHDGGTVLDEEMEPIFGSMSRRKFLRMFTLGTVAAMLPFSVYAKDDRFITVVVTSIDEDRESLGAIADAYCDPNVLARFYGQKTYADAVKRLGRHNGLRPPNYIVMEGDEIEIPKVVLKRKVGVKVELVEKKFPLEKGKGEDIVVTIDSSKKHQRSVGAICDHYCDPSRMVKKYSTRTYAQAIVALAKENGIDDASKVHNGQKIKIPKEVVKLELWADYDGVKREVRRSRVKREVQDRGFQSPFGGTTKIAPHHCFAGTPQNKNVMGRVMRVCPFDTYNARRSRGRKHRALDAYGLVGTPLYPLKPGKVVGAGYYYLSKTGAKKKFAFWKNNGKAVKVQTADGYTFMYIHLKDVHVRLGQRVDYQTQLGTLGISGNASAANPHVHITMHKDGRLKDPYKYLKFIG